ncbi:hypothetical protein GCM10023187_04120 [Nibrella viscosa]|uniref:Uncharacterized protein n=1 Tax=Nibrella viscosa TaxID=1084524 RepID=A0ABP8JUI3_9BACT
MSYIRKSATPSDIHQYDKEYWWSKTPQERLDAALELILYAKALYRANPNNPPLTDGNRILKLRSPAERGRR